MNKKQFLLILPVSCLLMSCRGGGKTQSLISGGENQDLTKEETVQRFEKDLKQSASVLVDKLNAVKVVASIDKFKGEYNYLTKFSGLESDVSIKVKEVKGSITAQVENLFSPIKEIGAYAAIKDFTFDINESVSTAGDKQAMDFKCDPISLTAYKKDQFAYADISDKNLSKFVESIDAISGDNTKIAQLINSITNGATKCKLDLSALIPSSVFDVKLIDQSTIKPYIENAVDEFIKFSKESKFEGVTFVEFENNGYGVQVDALKVLNSAGVSLSNYGFSDDSASVQLAMEFNNDFSPRSLVVDGSIDFARAESSEGIESKISIEGEAKISAKFTYGESISYPSFSDYKEISIK